MSSPNQDSDVKANTAFNNSGYTLLLFKSNKHQGRRSERLL